MSLNSFGHLFRVTTWGESHGPALGATVDGCPAGISVDEAMIQHWLDKRKPGQNKFTTQRREADEVEILSGIFPLRLFPLILAARRGITLDADGPVVYRTICRILTKTIYRIVFTQK